MFILEIFFKERGNIFLDVPTKLRIYLGMIGNDK